MVKMEYGKVMSGSRWMYSNIGEASEAIVVSSRIPHVGNGAPDMIDIRVCMRATILADIQLFQPAYGAKDQDRARVLPAEAQDASPQPNAQATRVHQSMLPAAIGATSAPPWPRGMKQIRRPCYLNDETSLARLNAI